MKRPIYDMFRFTEPSSGQFLQQSKGTFSECTHYGIPYCLQIILTLTFYAYRLRDAPTIYHSTTVRSAYAEFVFCIYLRTNSDLCHLQHKLIGFYNRHEKCLQRGTDWVFK